MVRVASFGVHRRVVVVVGGLANFLSHPGTIWHLRQIDRSDSVRSDCASPFPADGRSDDLDCQQVRLDKNSIDEVNSVVTSSVLVVLGLSVGQNSMDETDFCH